MKTFLQIGHRVRASLPVQGLVPGHTYTVTDVQVMDTPFGRFVTYVLDERFPVVNGHLLLSPVTDR